MITIALNSDHFKNAFSGSGTLFKENEDGDQGSREDFEEYLRFNYEKKVDFQQKNLVRYQVLGQGEPVLPELLPSPRERGQRRCLCLGDCPVPQ